MRRLWKFFFLGLILAQFFAVHAFAAEKARKKSVNERILEILIQRNIITEQEYEELKKQVKEEEEEKKPNVVAGFKRGFFIETRDKKSKIKIGGRFQGDSKFYLQGFPSNDSFFARRARLSLSGTISEYYGFKVEAEFGKGKTSLTDGFMNISCVPYAQLKFGQFKTPYSMEELQSDNWMDFIERSLANDLVPSRDLGLMIHGKVKDEILYYQIGVFNGYRKNEANDKDNYKDLAARLVFAPFSKSGSTLFEGLRLGAAVTYGNEELESGDWWNKGKFATGAGTVFLAMNDGVLQKGHRTRLGGELYWGLGSTVFKAEYMDVTMDGLTIGSSKGEYGFQGGYISISHCLTGEKFVYKNGKPSRIVPLKNFSFKSPGWGAFQIGARWDFLKADKELLELGYADPYTYTDKASGITVGLNWYPTDMIRFMINFSHTKFDDKITVDNKKVKDEDVILTRFEIALD